MIDVISNSTNFIFDNPKEVIMFVSLTLGLVASATGLFSTVLAATAVAVPVAAATTATIRDNVCTISKKKRTVIFRIKKD